MHSQRLTAAKHPQRGAGADTRACGLASARGRKPRCSTSQPCTCRQDTGVNSAWKNEAG